MKTSDSIAKIAAALVKAQTAIEGVKKDKTGKIQTKTGSGYEYKYSDLASVIEAVKGPLNINDIVFVQSPAADSTGVMVTTTLLHSSGEWISETTYMPVAQATPQAYGSAITYAKRYGLQSMTGLPSEDDDGAKGGEGHDSRGNATTRALTNNERPISATQVAVDAFAALPEDEQAFLRDQAMRVMGLHKEGGDMVAFIEAANYDTEEKLALWSLLPSDCRSAIKKQQSAKAAA